MGLSLSPKIVAPPKIYVQMMMSIGLTPLLKKSAAAHRWGSKDKDKVEQSLSSHHHGCAAPSVGCSDASLPAPESPSLSREIAPKKSPLTALSEGK
jgi:hypothetical protein